MDLIDTQRDVLLPYLAHRHRDAAHGPSSIFEHYSYRDVYGTAVWVAALYFSRIDQHGVGHGSNGLFHSVWQELFCPRYDSGGGVLPLSNFRGVEHACQGDRRRRPADDGFERCDALSLISLISAFLRQSGPYCSHLPLQRSSWRDN